MSPIVCVISRERTLGSALVEHLKTKGCAAGLVSKPSRIPLNVTYLVILDLDGKLVSDRNLLSFIQQVKPRVVVVNSSKSREGLVSSVLAKQIFVDNVVPGHAQLISDLHAKSQHPHVLVPKEAWFAVVTQEELFAKIVALLFSFPENKSFLFGKLVSFGEYVKFINPNATVSVDLRLAPRMPRGDIQVEEAKIDLAQLAVKQTPSKTTSFPKKTIVSALLLVMALLVMPYLLLGASLGLSYWGYKSLTTGNYLKTINLLKASSTLSVPTAKVLDTLRFPARNTANSLSNANLVLQKAVDALMLAKDIAQTNDATSVAGLSHNLSVKLASLYQDMIVFRTDLEYVLSFTPSLEVDVAKLSEYVLLSSKFTKNLPELLGYNTPQTYLLLLQNNMELRPTGGFIGSFALVTLARGELIDDTVYDVYSADGQLKGYIEPPAPIVEHLGEASWKMRDSNWDPDFPTSAERAEWFLDKTLDRDVAGVIAINLESVKNYLEVLGPVYLSTFGETIDSKNMYEKVKYEVEDNFFPGSRKKAQYLSALSDALILKMGESLSTKTIDLLGSTVKSVDARDIQVYLHNTDVATLLSDLGWDGGVFNKDCEEGCMYLPLGVVEANVGVNKANYFVKRQVALRSTIKDIYIEQALSLTLTNTSEGLERIPEERYKVYVRGLAPLEAQFPTAQLSGSKAEWLDIDSTRLSNRNEYGVILEVLPGETKTLTYSWRVPFDQKPNKLKLHFWKQSGTGEFPLSVTLDAPNVRQFSSNPPFGLTDEGSFGYNTNLSSDFISELTFTNE